MKKRVTKIFVALALVAVVFASVFLLSACNAMTTRHSGRTETNSIVAFETEFNYITFEQFVELRTTWNETDEDQRDYADFISGSLAGGTPTVTVHATQRRQLFSVDMFGDINWNTPNATNLPRGAERAVGQGYFVSQTNDALLTRTGDNNLGTPEQVATALGLGAATVTTWTAGDLNTQLLNRWNATGAFAPATVTTENQNAQRITNRTALRTALSNLILTEEERAMGYFVFPGFTAAVSPYANLATLPFSFGAGTVGATGVINLSANLLRVRFIQQTVTRVYTYFAEATVNGAQSVDRVMPRVWNAQGTELLDAGTLSTTNANGMVTIIYGEDNHAMRPVMMTRVSNRVYDRGIQTDHNLSVTYVGNQVRTMTPAMGVGAINFIINRPAGH